MQITQRSPPIHWISKFLKEELKYSYKRGSSRSTLSHNPKLKYMQWIFSKMVIDFIAEKKIIFNVDESTYSRSIKCNYSWLPLGESSAIINSNWTGKANVIFGLSTDGNWLAVISDKTTNSVKFWRYLLLLRKFVTIWMKVDSENVVYTLDNAPIHVSLKTKKAAEQLETKLFLLPPYSPSLAPTEWVFGVSKKRLSSQKKMRSINFSKQRGKIEIIECFNMIDRNSGVRIWMQFFKSVYKIFESIEIPLLLSSNESENHEETKE